MKFRGTAIDIETLSVEDLKAIEREIHILRKRREDKECFKNRMIELIEEANAAGFDFIDKDFGVIHSVDIELYDYQ